jgi:hypothetical protein
VSQQGPSLLSPEWPGFTNGQSTQTKRPHSDPDQSPHGKPEDEQTSPNLTFPPFDQHQPKARSTRVRIESHGTDAPGRGSSVFEANALLKPTDCALVDLALHADLVLTLVAMRGMQQGVRGITIVCEQQQSRCLAVQSTDRKNPADVSWQKIDDGSPAFVVANRRHYAAGFIEDPITRFLAEQPFAIQSNIVDARIGPITQNRDTAIHGHALLDHELLDLTTGPETGGGQ